MKLVRSQEMPPFSLRVYYRRRRHCFLLEVRHADGRVGVADVPASYVPVFGIDVSDNEEISLKAEQICRQMEAEQ